MGPSIKEIRKLCKKPYWCGILKFMHYLANYITWIFARTPITPNQITILWVFLETLGPFLLVTGNYGYMLAGIMIYHFVAIIDCVDGRLASYK